MKKLEDTIEKHRKELMKTHDDMGLTYNSLTSLIAKTGMRPNEALSSLDSNLWDTDLALILPGNITKTGYSYKWTAPTKKPESEQWWNIAETIKALKTKDKANYIGLRRYFDSICRRAGIAPQESSGPKNYTLKHVRKGKAVKEFLAKMNQVKSVVA